MERPTFDDTFGYTNEMWTRQAAGPLVGRVQSVNHKTYRATVYMPQFDIFLTDVRVGTEWHGGTKTGRHAMPMEGCEVEVQLENGKGAGVGQARITKVLYSGDFLPPEHPSMEGEKHFYATQYRLGTEDRQGPGNFEMFDEKGGKHTLQMGKQTHQGQGAVDQRDKGLSITEPEDHGLRAANGMAMASRIANKIPTKISGPQDLVAMAQGLSALNRSTANSIRAASNAAQSQSHQVVRQSEAVAIGNNAGHMASGTATTDQLTQMS